jgi:hypothetical protein
MKHHIAISALMGSCYTALSESYLASGDHRVKMNFPSIYTPPEHRYGAFNTLAPDSNFEAQNQRPDDFDRRQH